MENITHTWIFFEEGKENNPEFEIKATSSNVYDLAFENFGPQIEGLLYKVKLN